MVCNLCFVLCIAGLNAVWLLPREDFVVASRYVLLSDCGYRCSLLWNVRPEVHWEFGVCVCVVALCFSVNF